jgi:uncharacterized protein (TIGR03437 family)
MAQSGSVLNLSRDLVARGVASQNLTPNTPTLDARPLFEAALKWAPANGITSIVADPGSYYFLTQHSPAQHLLVTAINLTIDLQNSDLYFAKSNTAAIECQSCSSVTFQNFTVDYQQLPFTQATITAVDAPNGKLTFQALPGWQTPADFSSARAPDAGDVIRMFVFRNGDPLPQVGRLVAQRPFSGTGITISNATDPWALPANLAAIQPGDTLLFTDRGGPPAINVSNGQKVAVRNISVYAAGSTAVQFARTAAATIDHVQVIPRPGTTRLISANGRGIVSTYAPAGNTITNNLVRRTCDDAISLTTPWIATVTATAGPVVTVSRRGDSPFADKASLSFINPADASVVTSANIVSQSPLAANQAVTDGESVSLTLDKTIANLAPGMGVVDNDSSKRGNGSVVSGNLAREIVFGSGLVLAGVQNVQVHDNFTRQTAAAGILVRQWSGTSPDPGSPDWNTGPATELTIKNNAVDLAVGYGNPSAGPISTAASIYAVSARSDGGQVTTRPHSIFSVANNRISNSARSAIRLQNVAGGDASRNVVQGSGLNPSTNLFALPACCETQAQFVTDFSQPVLTTGSLLTVAGNTTADSSGTVAAVSTASYFPKLAPATWAVAYGSNFASALAFNPAPFPTSLNGVTVQVTDSAGATRPAQIYYVAPPTAGTANSSAVCFLVPEGTATGLATVTIGSASGNVLVESVAPGFYSANSSGQGVAAAGAAVYGTDGSVALQTVFRPSPAGFVASPMDTGGPNGTLIVFLYGTGLRGFGAAKNYAATIGGIPATVQYIGAVAGNPGLDQVNLIVPKSLAGAREVPVVLTVDGQTANAVTISLK